MVHNAPKGFPRGPLHCILPGCGYVDRDQPPRRTRIYVAGKFEEHPLVREVYEELRYRGFEITYPWAELALKNEKRIPTPEEWRKIGEDELQAVRTADIILTLPHEHGLGLWVEYGIGLAFGKVILLVGEPRHDGPFFYLQGVRRVPTLSEAYRYLDEEVRSL